MRSEWYTKKLNSVVDYVVDNRGRNPKQYTDYGIPVIDNYLITSEGKVDLSNVKRFIDDNTYNSFLRKYIEENDVLMTLVGNGYGKVAITPKEKCTIIQNTIGLRCNEDNSNIFLYYLLSNNRESFMNLNRGAAQPSIKVGDVLGVQFEFPPLSTQKKIAHILSTLDDKIELNRKMNQTLEEMAQALFKSWFVDFDPVHVKAGCKSDAELERGARELGISKEVLELFPSEFEESELGMIPEGWEVKKVSELVSKSNTGADAIQKAPIVDYDTGIRCARVGDFSNNRSLPSWGFSKVDEKNYKNYKLMKNDILITRTSLIGLSKIIREDIPAVYNNGLIRIKPIISSEFLYINFQSNIFKTYISRITGESSTRPNMKINYFLDYKLIMPDEKILTIIHDTLFTLLEELDCNIKQIDTLQKTRDTLLPKLLSGELDVSNINARAEYEL